MDVYEGADSEILYTTKLDKNSYIGTTGLIKANMARRIT